MSQKPHLIFRQGSWRKTPANHGPAAPIARRVMLCLGLSQEAFADAIGASLDRVKSLSTGRVKTLRTSETRSLVNRLGVSATFLTTGMPPILRSDEAPKAHSEFIGALLRLKETLGVQTDKAVALALGMSNKSFDRRKHRNRFPVKELELLAFRRPDLRIDVKRILGGGA